MEIEEKNKKQEDEKLTIESLAIIQKADILPEKDRNILVGLKDELRHGFIHGQVHRTRTEAEISVLEDLKFPTQDSKYWQAIREQQVHFAELVMLSYEYQKNLKEIEILEAEIMALESEKNDSLKDYELKKLNAEIDLKEIEINKKLFIAANQRRTATARMREIINWHEIKAQLLPKLQYGTDDVNAHQLGSYLQRFINQYLDIRKHNLHNIPPADLNNLVGQLITTYRRAEEVGIKDKVLQEYSPTDRRLIEQICSGVVEQSKHIKRRRR